MKVIYDIPCWECNGNMKQIDVPKDTWEYDKLYFFKCEKCGEEIATLRDNPLLKILKEGK